MEKMIKKSRFTLLLLMLILFTACSQPTDEALVQESYPYPTFDFTHFASGGNAEIYPAVILFEQSVSTFTSYQVAFVSCTCRDSLVNYYSVCYVELLNNKPSAEQ